jgi:hypothetical protein
MTSGSTHIRPNTYSGGTTPTGELLRIPLPGTSVNKAIYSTLQLRFCLDEFLDVSNAPLHQAADAILHRFIDRHVGSDR